MVNRDIPHKENDYLKKVQPKYEEIYGDKGTKFCQGDENNEKKELKTNNRVKFSTIVEYSRN